MTFNVSGAIENHPGVKVGWCGSAAVAPSVHEHTFWDPGSRFLDRWPRGYSDLVGWIVG